SSDLALVCGRSSGTPTVSSGAETMKMISSTSMTSTIGVTLISLMTARRRCRRRLISTVAPLAPPAPMVPSRALVDLTRQNGGKLVGKAFEPLRLLVHVGDKFVIENRRGYGGNKADRGGKQRLGNARRHHRERGVL